MKGIPVVLNRLGSTRQQSISFFSARRPHRPFELGEPQNRFGPEILSGNLDKFLVPGDLINRFAFPMRVPIGPELGALTIPDDPSHVYLWNFPSIGVSLFIQCIDDWIDLILGE